MKKRIPEIEHLAQRYPVLDTQAILNTIEDAIERLEAMYRKQGLLLICGNGGSAADADHIVAELMKRFLRKRPLRQGIKEKLTLSKDPKAAELLLKLQGALPAINLSAQMALTSAYSNDVDPAYSYAQQIGAYGRPGDALLAITTSGNSENIINAAAAAQFIGLEVIALTGGADTNRLGIENYSDVVIKVPANTTPEIQELHLPLYHAICAALERLCFEDADDR